ncbi:MAG: DUF371 domain-containing protein [Candidatus Thorarchaeota archaeon]|nr:DUF371 domain-containing protein [Candidatus Thorarchaeota archaeon]
MEQIEFQARGHRNIRGTHKTTIEITRETSLTPQGDCIIGVGATLALRDIPRTITTIASEPSTIIRLELDVNGLKETIEGQGGKGLVYTNPICMVARKSSYVCGRTLMINADRAAIDLDREFIETLRDPNIIIQCKIIFTQ